MTDYIKRIQSNLSGKKIKLGRPVIREELELLGYTNETLTDELAVSVIDTLVDKFGDKVEVTKLLSDCEPINALTSQEPETTHQNPNTDLDTDAITDTLTDSNYTDNFVTDTIARKTESEQETGTGIVVSEEEKHDLITSQASVLGFSLSEEDATCIAETVDEIFESYTHLIDTISTAIKSYFDHRFDSVEESLESNSENLREHFASRKEKLNQKIAGFKNDVKADLGGIRNDIKSVQFAFTERLRIPAKT